jgi:hypothetical protein
MASIFWIEIFALGYLVCLLIGILYCRAQGGLNLNEFSVLLLLCLAWIIFVPVISGVFLFENGKNIPVIKSHEELRRIRKERARKRKEGFDE